MFFSSKADIMDKQKAEINILWREAKVQMKVFTINDLTLKNRKVHYQSVSKEVKTLLVKLLYLYEELFDMIVDKDGDEMKVEQQKCTQQKGEIKDYLSKLEERYYELEAEEASTGEASVSAVDKRVAALEQAMKEQLEDSRRREEGEQQAKQEKEKITKEKTEANFCVESEGSKEEAELISSPVTKIPLGIWKDVEEDKVEKLKQRRIDLIAQRAEAGIILDDIPGCLDTRQAANQAADSVQEVKDELNSEDLVKKDEECFADLKMKICNAFKHNQDVWSAKDTKIKELLQGDPKNFIPDTLEKFNDIYKASDKAFGDPTRLLNYRKTSLTSSNTTNYYPI